MLLSGTKRSWDVSGESNDLTKYLEKILKKRKVAMLYHQEGIKVLSDKSIGEVGKATFREMIIKRGHEYAAVTYSKGSKEPPDVMVAYPRLEKYKKHV